MSRLVSPSTPLPKLGLMMMMVGSLLLLISPSATTTVVVAAVQWKTVFIDQFDGPSGSPPNSTFWQHEIGYQRNNEWQYYTDRTKNANLSGTSSLKITAYREDWKDQFKYTSASIFTKPPFLHKYGRISMRAKVPAGPGMTGTWPAFWLLGEDIEQVGWPLCGEIDVMEAVGYEPNVGHDALHMVLRNGMYGNNPHGKRSLTGIANEWHNYSVEWSPSNFTFFIDEHQVLTYANDGNCNPKSWPFDQHFNLKLNFAVGGSWGAVKGVNEAAFPLTFEIDYVKWEQPVGLDPEKPDTYPGILPGQYTCNDTRLFGILTPVASPSPLTRNSVLVSAAFTDKSKQTSILDAMKIAVKDITGAPAVESILAFSGLTLLPSQQSPFIVINMTIQNGHLVKSSLDAAAGSTAASPPTNAPSLGTAISLLQNAIDPSVAWKLVNFSLSCWAPLCTVDKNGQSVSQPIAFESITLPGTLPATSYDFGGPGEGYGDTTAHNEYNKNTYRAGPDGVDIQTASTAHNQGWNPATMLSQGGPHYIGYMNLGEWLRYSGLELPRDTGSIHIEISGATGMPAGRDGVLRFTLCGPWLADAATDAERCQLVWSTDVTIPGGTGDWETFKLWTPDGGQPTIDPTRGTRVGAGRYQLRVRVTKAPVCLHGIKFSIGPALAPTPLLPTTAASTTSTTLQPTTTTTATSSTVSTSSPPTSTTTMSTAITTTTSLPTVVTSSSVLTTHQPSLMTSTTTSTPVVTTTVASTSTTTIEPVRSGSSEPTPSATAAPATNSLKKKTSGESTSAPGGGKATPETDSSSSNSSTTTVIGLLSAVLVLLVIVIAVLAFLLVKKTKSEEQRRNHSDDFGEEAAVPLTSANGTTSPITTALNNNGDGYLPERNADINTNTADEKGSADATTIPPPAVPAARSTAQSPIPVETGGGGSTHNPPTPDQLALTQPDLDTTTRSDLSITFSRI